MRRQDLKGEAAPTRGQTRPGLVGKVTRFPAASGWIVADAPPQFYQGAEAPGHGYHVAMVDPDAERRRRLVRFNRDRERQCAALLARGVDDWDLARYWSPIPDDLRGLACGAKTRAGTPCKLTSIYDNGRCALHGGCSTGPTTPEGKARAAQNGLSPKTRKRTP